MIVHGKPLTPEIQELFSEHGTLVGVWIPGNGTIIANYSDYVITFRPNLEIIELDED